jgi:hypothetical protein
MATASTFRADLAPEWQAAWHLASAVTDRALSQGLATHLGASFIGQAVGPCLISDAARTSIPAAQPSCRRLAPLRHELHLGMVAVALAQSSEPAGPASGQGRVAHPLIRAQHSDHLFAAASAHRSGRPSCTWDCSFMSSPATMVDAFVLALSARSDRSSVAPRRSPSEGRQPLATCGSHDRWLCQVAGTVVSLTASLWRRHYCLACGANRGSSDARERNRRAVKRGYAF